MTQDEMKKAAAIKALDYIKADTIVGVGTGSTVNHFIDALATVKDNIIGAVSSSEASTERLKSYGIEVFELNNVDSIDVYVDPEQNILATSKLDVKFTIVPTGTARQIEATIGFSNPF